MRRSVRLWAALAALPAAVAVAGPVMAHPHVWITTETTVLFEQGTIVGLRHIWTFDEFYSAMAIQGLDANKNGIYERSELEELARVNVVSLREFDYFTYARLAEAPVKLALPRDFYLEHVEAPLPAAPAPDTGAAAPGGAAAPPPVTLPSAEPGMLERMLDWVTGRSPAKPDQGSSTEPAKRPRPKVLRLVMTLPFEQPILAEAKGFSFTVADPSFFIAFEPAEKNPVVFGPGAPPGCKVSIGESARPREESLQLGESFARELGGQPIGFGFARPFSVSCEAPS